MGLPQTDAGIAKWVLALIANGQLIQVLPTYRRASSELGLQLVYTSRPPVPPAVAAF
jgi:hypothetical protein